ncbi:unnamed protein product [Arctia plantaginis]|uniref:Uncharacterized protein n=1 Tax=Arctia plantaginis TaxID=874455 RepID=A0A8S1A366_ARCPL|nr:unnamed protein product [Arctia plantaginis]CAB3239102.1 unnamed protein product [Arctia plantaginis]
MACYKLLLQDINPNFYSFYVSLFILIEESIQFQKRYFNMVNQTWGFCDLCIHNNYDLDKLHYLEKLGFHTVAIDTHVEESSDEPKKKKKKGGSKEKNDFIPAPLEISADVSKLTKLNILQRVTIEFSDSSIAHKLNQSEHVKKYDIIAVVPKTLQAFHYACGTMEVDIITFSPECRIPFKVSRSLYTLAAQRGVFFEIMYSPAIRDATSRKNIISTAHTYHAVGKSRNIIVTSGAENYMHVRDVHDVINLGYIFGLNSNQSLETIRNNARRLILKAEARKCGKHYMIVNTLSENDSNKMIENYVFY